VPFGAVRRSTRSLFPADPETGPELIELDRRFELQGDNIGPRIAPGGTCRYRGTVGLRDLGRVSFGEYLFGSDHQITPPQGAAPRGRLDCADRDNRTLCRGRRCGQRAVESCRSRSWGGYVLLEVDDAEAFDRLSAASRDELRRT
jgi:hypothetical protein